MMSNISNENKSRHRNHNQNKWNSLSSSHSAISNHRSWSSGQTAKPQKSMKPLKSLKSLDISLIQRRTSIDRLSNGQLLNNFELQKEIGYGSFGSVWKAVSHIDGQSYAMKLIPFLQKSMSDFNHYNDSIASLLKAQKETIREARSMAGLTSHPCLIRYYTSWIEELTDSLYEKVKDIPLMQSSSLSMDSVQAKEKTTSVILPDCLLIIQMEYCDHGTLKQWLEQRQCIDYEVSINILHQIVLGLNHIHNNGIIHRDIKPENIFLTNKGLIKLGDFGLSVSLKESYHPNNIDNNNNINNNNNNNNINMDYDLINNLSFTAGLGTPTYAAPEQFFFNDIHDNIHNNTNSNQYSYYSQPADIYPLGLIAYELFNVFSTQMERAKSLMNLKTHGQTPGDFNTKYHRISKLICNMLSKLPECRPTTNDILTTLEVECGASIGNNNNNNSNSSNFRIRSVSTLSLSLVTTTSNQSQSIDMNDLKKLCLSKDMQINTLQTRIKELEQKLFKCQINQKQTPARETI